MYNTTTLLVFLSATSAANSHTARLFAHIKAAVFAVERGSVGLGLNKILKEKKDKFFVLLVTDYIHVLSST